MELDTKQTQTRHKPCKNITKACLEKNEEKMEKKTSKKSSVRDFYKISEISKLYGIGPDSIRYYEKLGILKPRRDVNGYRLYSLKEMYKLNMIRDLRRLDFTMEQIKDYLDNQSVYNTLEHLSKEQRYVKHQIRELQLREQLLFERAEDIKKSLRVTADKIEILTIDYRYCVRINQRITRDEEMDFLMKKLEQKHEGKIRDFGNQTIGAFYDMDAVNRGTADIYESLFFVLEMGTDEYEFVLPKGRYISCFYRGSYSQSKKCCQKVLNYAKENKLENDGKLFEFYHIDNRDTMDEKEFLTEIQLRLI